jgi:hypothetical protein
MKPIHVSHAPKLIKWKNKTALLEFTNRFYSPAIFIVGLLSAYRLIEYTYALPILIILAILSSIVISYSAWHRWKKDFFYLAEKEQNIPRRTTIVIVLTECVLQFLVSIISFWWISGVPACIASWTDLNRITQAYVWTSLLVFTFVMHIVAWKRSSKEMYRCLRETYEHLEMA